MNRKLIITTIVLIALAVIMVVLWNSCGKKPTPGPTPAPSPTVLPTPKPTPSPEEIKAGKATGYVVPAKPKRKAKVSKQAIVYTCETAKNHAHCKPNGDCSDIVEADMDIDVQTGCNLTGIINGVPTLLFGDVRSFQHPNAAQKIHVRYCRLCGQIIFARFQ